MAATLIFIVSRIGPIGIQSVDGSNQTPGKSYLPLDILWTISLEGTKVTVLLILGGKLEIGAPVRSHLFYFICARQ